MAPLTLPRGGFWTVDGRRIPLIAGGDDDGYSSSDELRERIGEIDRRLVEIDSEFHGKQFTEEVTGEWNDLNTERDQLGETLHQVEARQERLRQIADQPASREEPSFHTPRAGVARGDSIYDLTTIRSLNPEQAGRELRDRVMRSAEPSSFPHPDISQDAAQRRISELLDRFGSDEESDDLTRFARRVLQTGAPIYKRAFGKQLAGRPLTSDEQRALSLTVSEGGYAVPYTLDPTIIPTSNGTVNPLRRLARVEPITGQKWQGVTSGAITAAYAAEGTEASDNAPTIGQPEIDAERAQAFVPYSIEIGQDWGALQSEMAMLLQDAKDDLEAVKFFTGGGTNEPFGLLTGLTTSVRVQTAASAAFAVADLYSLEAAVPPRFRARSAIVGNRFSYQKVRQFDTAGGADLWVRLPQGLANNQEGATGYELLGYPAAEATSMGAALTSGTKLLVMGDFRHFVIVERIGMSVDVIPHLFGTGSNFPTGQRGLYAFWRNGSKVVVEGAFRYLETL